MMESRDRIRQIAVSAAEVFCVLGTLVGVGVLGTRVEESSGGALAADATLLAPAGPAFSIWTPVYIGLFVYAIWQWRTSVATTTRHRRIGWLAALSMVLNASWLLVTQQGWIWASVVVIGALLATLGLLVVRLTAEPARSWPERIIVDGTFGLYLGWVCVATCANVTAAFAASGVELDQVVAERLAYSVLAAVAIIAGWLAAVYRGRLAVAAAIAWGLCWIAVGRLTDQPRSGSTAAAALVAAAVVIAVTLFVRFRSPRVTPAS